MKQRIIAITGVLLVFIACGKDSFQTRPSLKLKSLSTQFVPAGSESQLSVVLEFTDKEGDIKGDTVQIIKVRTNKRKTPTVRDTIYLLTADNLSGRTKGEIELRLQYQNHLISANDPRIPGGGIENDTLTMKFLLKDNASHVSDTVVAKDIVIQRN